MFRRKRVKRIKAKTLLRDAKRLLKKKGRRLNKESCKAVEQTIAELQAVLKTGSPDEIERAREKLGEAVARHIPRTGYDLLVEYARALAIAILIALFVRQFVVEPYRIPTGSMVPTLAVGDKILVTKFTYGITIPFTSIKVLDLLKPNRWDVVVFTTNNIKNSSSIEKNFVKRVVGLPGDTIEIRNGEIYRHDIDKDGRETVALLVKPDYLKQLEPRYCYYENVGEDKTSRIELYDEKRVFGILPVRSPNGDTRLVKWKYGHIGQRIEVPPGHYFVLGDNSHDSFDSRGWGFVPFENIRGKVICKWKFLPPWGDGIVR
jgi:signal peptidase I